MIEWENGEVTTDPLAIITADSCSIYGKDNDLLDIDGWKRFKGIARREKVLNRLVHQSKLCSYRTSPKFKCGYEIPRDYTHAM
jgi:hypothetical protein